MKTCGGKDYSNNIKKEKKRERNLHIKISESPLGKFSFLPLVTKSCFSTEKEYLVHNYNILSRMVHNYDILPSFR
jgi:hypothetical protein